jgi:hypothetical protein
MNCLYRIVLAGMVAVTIAISAAGQETPPAPAARPAVKVEFFWAETEPVPGVTVEKGVVWNESGGMLYLHTQPILTNKDVAEVKVTKTVFGGSMPMELFTVHFHLTKEARKKLAASCPADGDGLLPVKIDGRQFGTPYYLKSRDEASFVPFAGFLTSKETVDRIVATFAPAKPETPKPVDK